MNREEREASANRRLEEHVQTFYENDDVNSGYDMSLKNWMVYFVSVFGRLCKVLKVSQCFLLCFGL